MYHHIGQAMGWGMLPMMFGWTLLIVGLSWLGVSVISRQRLENRPKGEEILEERYARGEISREDFLSMKADLGH